MKGICSGCPRQARPGQRWCLECHKLNMRKHRKERLERETAALIRIAELEARIAELEARRGLWTRIREWFGRSLKARFHVKHEDQLLVEK